MTTDNRGQVEADLKACLEPGEYMVVHIARSQLQRGLNPPINTTGVLMLIIERLARKLEQERADEYGY